MDIMVVDRQSSIQTVKNFKIFLSEVAIAKYVFTERLKTKLFKLRAILKPTYS